MEIGYREFPVSALAARARKKLEGSFGFFDKAEGLIMQAQISFLKKRMHGIY